MSFYRRQSLQLSCRARPKFAAPSSSSGAPWRPHPAGPNSRSIDAMKEAKKTYVNANSRMPTTDLSATLARATRRRRRRAGVGLSCGSWRHMRRVRTVITGLVIRIVISSLYVVFRPCAHFFDHTRSTNNGPALTKSRVTNQPNSRNGAKLHGRKNLDTMASRKVVENCGRVEATSGIGKLRTRME